MTPKQILEECRAIHQQIAVLQKQLDRCQGTGAPTGHKTGARLEKVPGKDEYVLPLPGTNNPTGAALQHAENYEAALDKLWTVALNLKMDAERAIRQCSGVLDRSILTYYYVLGYSDSTIALQLNYSRAAVCIRRNRILQELDKAAG